MNALETLVAERKELQRKKKSAESTIRFCDKGIEELDEAIEALSKLPRYWDEPTE